MILGDMEPVWDETAFIPVGPEELNAEERIRVQLWDSDRTSADDDLGRVEVDLKELMNNPKSKGKMWDRSDGFLALEGVCFFHVPPISLLQHCTKCMASLCSALLHKRGFGPKLVAEEKC